MPVQLGTGGLWLALLGALVVATGGIWLSLGCPLVPLSSSEAKPGILEEVRQFGKEAVKVVKFARKPNEVEAARVLC